MRTAFLERPGADRPMSEDAFDLHLDALEDLVASSASVARISNT